METHNFGSISKIRNMIDERTPTEKTQYQTIPRKHISRQSSILLPKSKCLNGENVWTHLIFYTCMFTPTWFTECRVPQRSIIKFVLTKM